MLRWMMIVDSSSSSCSLPWSLLFDQRRLIHQEKKKHTSAETNAKRQQYKTTHSKEAPLSRDATRAKSPSKSSPQTKVKKDRWTDVEGSRQHKRQLARSQGGLPPNAATTSRRKNDDEAPLTRSSTLPTRSRTTTKPFVTTRRHPESTRKSPAPVSIQHDRRDYPPEALDVYIACHAGLQSLLYAELDHLRLPYIPKGFGASLLAPVSVDDLFTCHLYLGTAAHVFVRCGPSWDARALGEVQRKTAEMPWRYMLPDAFESTGVLLPRLQVKVTATKSRLLHTTAIRDHVLKGIYAALGIPDAWNANDDDTAPARSPDTTRLSVQLYRDNVQISLDTSETPIHQRGYRLETCKAPLREDLAYALLFSAGWKPRYTWTPRQGHFVSESQSSSQYTALLDPFCGSGTLPIEAAAMAAGLPPGRLRPAPLRGTPLYDPPRWDALLQKAMQHSSSASPKPESLVIAASDRDAGAVRSTAANAARAGVPPLQLQQCAFTQHPWWSDAAAPPPNTLLAANLPFGRRISALATAPPPNYAKHPLLPLYQSLGNHMRRGSWPRGAVFLTDDRELLRHGGFAQPFTTTLSTTHGGIPVVGMCMQRRAEEEKDDGVVVENTAAA